MIQELDRMEETLAHRAVQQSGDRPEEGPFSHRAAYRATRDEMRLVFPKCVGVRSDGVGKSAPRSSCGSLHVEVSQQQRADYLLGFFHVEAERAMTNWPERGRTNNHCPSG